MNDNRIRNVMKRFGDIWPTCVAVLIIALIEYIVVYVLLGYFYYDAEFRVYKIIQTTIFSIFSFQS